MLDELRMAPLLHGVRGEAPVDMGALSESICRFAQLVVDLTDLAELEVNPLVAGADGVIAVDARASLAPQGVMRRTRDHGRSTERREEQEVQAAGRRRRGEAGGDHAEGGARPTAGQDPVATAWPVEADFARCSSGSMARADRDVPWTSSRASCRRPGGA